MATRPVAPLGQPEQVGDVVALHEQHGIDLLVLPRLEEHFARVRADGWDFSAIRMRNAGLGPGAFAT